MPRAPRVCRTCFGRVNGSGERAGGARRLPTDMSRLRCMRTVTASLGVLVALGLAAGCGDDEGAEVADATALEGAPWTLASGIDVAGWEAVAPGATFADGTVSGSTGCNRFTAGYEVDGDALTIDTIASTRKACAPPADAVETAYVDALARVAGWRVDDEGLTLLDADTAPVLGYRAASPAGSWEATATSQGDAFASPLPGTTITATFAADGTLSGSAGCNTYRAGYTLAGGAITIDAPASTRKLCPTPEGVMEQEAAYLAALERAARFQVEGGSLSLFAADGTFVATYSPDPAAAAPAGSG